MVWISILQSSLFLSQSNGIDKPSVKTYMRTYFGRNELIFLEDIPLKLSGMKFISGKPLNQHTEQWKWMFTILTTNLVRLTINNGWMKNYLLILLGIDYQQSLFDLHFKLTQT